MIFLRSHRLYFLISLSLCSLYLLYVVSAIGTFREVFSTVTPKPMVIHWKKTKTDFNCFYSTKDDALPSAEDPGVIGNNSMFFIETSCRGGLNSREACAMESAARLHPNRQVILLFLSPITEHMLKNSSLLKLREFGNINLLRVHIKEYSKGTVIEDIISRKLQTSKYLMEHTADILRILTLHKFGGIYLDTDSLLIKNLDSLPLNWIAKELNTSMSFGILALGKDPTGSKLASDLLTELHKTYKPTAWSFNGPKAVQRVLTRTCKNTLFKRDSCAGIKIFPPKDFYPVHYTQHKTYVKNGNISNMLEPYMHHMWNHFTGPMKIEHDSPYAKLARQFCPTIYEMYGDEFGE